MSQKFQANITHRDDVSYVKLGGVIDEDNQLADLVERIPQGTAVIDLGEVERINSCGVRDWVNWLGRLEGQRSKVVLVECSPAIVAQINLVNNFTANGVVKSFYVPYFCPECDEEKVLLVEATDMGAGPHEPPTCRCDECDLVMDFDDMPDSYFAFLSSQKRVAEPEKIASAVKALGGGGASAADAKAKSRSRSGSSAGGKSVPSLPSVSKPPAGSAPGRPSAAQLQVQAMQARASSGAGRNSSAAISTAKAAAPSSQAFGGALVPPARSNTMVFVLIGVLVVAIGVLAYLVLTQ